MRAVVIREPGGLDKLELCDWPAREPGPGQVRVRVAACGVCYRDIVDRLGKYPFMQRPIVTGHETAGIIEKVGPGVTEFAVGDRVASTLRPGCGECDECQRGEEGRCTGSAIMYGLTADGGYAEQCLLWTASMVKVPDQVPLEAACFLHCTASVALRALKMQGRLVAGQTVLITGASGGVGIHAVQIAKLLGARVLAVTSQAEKSAALVEYGADEVIVSSPDAIHKQVKGGVDLALDLVGVPTINSAMRSLRAGGRLVLVGNVTQERVEVNPGYLIMREIALVGSALASRKDLRQIFDWVVEGKLRPVIAARHPLADAQKAQAALGDKAVVGRQVIVP